MKSEKLEKILLFLTVLFLPTQLGKHFWPSFSFIYSLPIDYLSPVIYFWDLLVVSLFSVFLLQKKHINKTALNLVLVFLLTQSISLFGSSNLAAGLVRLEQYVICGLFGIYLASSKIKVQSSKLFWPILFSVLFESILAILQFIKGGTLGFWILGERSFTLSTPGIAKFDYHGLEFLRPYGTFPHPNVLAGFMIVTILLLSFLRKQESIQLLYGSRIKYGMTVVLAGLTLLLTVSRVAIIAGLGSALLTFKKKGRVLILLLVLLLLPVLYTRFSSVFNFDVLSLVRREEQISIAFNLWIARPVFGVGLNNFIIAASDQLLAGPSRFLQPVHNIFLLDLVETGVIGLFGLIILIGYPIKRIISYQLSVINLLPWFVILFLGMFDHYFLTLPQGYRMLFLVWGISMSMLKLEA